MSVFVVGDRVKIRGSGESGSVVVVQPWGEVRVCIDGFTSAPPSRPVRALLDSYQADQFERVTAGD